MKIIKGNLWDSEDDTILVTTNATIRKDGELVMGRGAAKELKTKFPLLPKLFGDQILNHYNGTKRYGILVAQPWVLSNGGEKLYKKCFGAFQVKYNFWEDADLDLIEYSTTGLIEILKVSVLIKNVSINFPGIGNGRLSKEDVLPIISRLSDNVTFYIKD